MFILSFVLIESQNHRIAEVTLVQSPCSSRATQSCLLRTMPRWLLNISKDRDSTTSLDNLCKGLVTHAVKDYFLMLRGSLLCFSLCLLLNIFKYLYTFIISP